MKKFLIKTALIFVIFAILYIPAYSILNMIADKDSQKTSDFEYLKTTEIKFNEIDSYKDIDILFVGSSHTYRSFDPRIFSKEGLMVFNIGTSSQTCMQSWFLIDRYIDVLNPKCVVYDLFPDLMNNKGEESTIDFISSNFEHNQAMWEWTKLKMALCTKNMYTINKWIYKAFQRHILRNENRIQTIKDDELRIRNERYIKGGFVERDMEYYDLSYDNRIDTTCKLGTMQMIFLRKTVNLLKDKGINYLLVETPVPSVLYKSYDNHDQYAEKISEYGTFYDYNTRLNLNDSLDFYDSHHLNQNGVVKYDSLLIKDLYELKYISDGINY